MRFRRRGFLHLAVGAAALPALPHSRRVFALEYPSRPVRIVVGFPAGGPGRHYRATDRQMAFSERLGQSFFIDNKPGAGGNVAAEAAAHAAADGYTLLQFTPSNAISDITP